MFVERHVRHVRVRLADDAEVKPAERPGRRRAEAVRP